MPLCVLYNTPEVLFEEGIKRQMKGDRGVETWMQESQVEERMVDVWSKSKSQEQERSGGGGVKRDSRRVECYG